jgi:hypothetical protein
LLIEEDNIIHRKHDGYLSAIERNILCHLRTQVHIRKSNNDDRLPSDWYAGRTLSMLSSPLKPKGPGTHANSLTPLVVFVRQLGLRNDQELHQLSPV